MEHEVIKIGINKYKIVFITDVLISVANYNISNNIIVFFNYNLTSFSCQVSLSVLIKTM